MLLPSDCINENALYTVHYAIKLTLSLFFLCTWHMWRCGRCLHETNTQNWINSIKILYHIFFKWNENSVTPCCFFCCSSSFTVGINFFFSLPISARFFCILLLDRFVHKVENFYSDVNANFIWYMFTIRNEIKTLKQ